MALNDLDVNIKANTRGLDQGLKRANRSQRQFVRDTERESRRMDRLDTISGGRLGAGRAMAARFGGAGLGAGIAGGAVLGAETARRTIRRVMQPIRQFGEQWERSSTLQRQFFDENEARFGEFSRRMIGGLRGTQGGGQSIFRNLMSAGVSQLVGDDPAPFLRRAAGGALGRMGFAARDPYQESRRRTLRQLMEGTMVSGAAEVGQAAEAQAIAGSIRTSFQRRMMTPEGRAGVEGEIAQRFAAEQFGAAMRREGGMAMERIN